MALVRSYPGILELGMKASLCQGGGQLCALCRGSGTTSNVPTSISGMLLGWCHTGLGAKPAAPSPAVPLFLMCHSHPHLPLVPLAPHGQPFLHGKQLLPPSDPT